jgi:Uncharacterized protein conserved in bacteria (DUF2188).
MIQYKSKEKEMNSIVDAFFNISIEKFRFLVDQFGFGNPKKRVGGGLYRVIYQSRSTAVEIGLEWREQYIYVELFRLIDGKIKENPIIIRPESKLNEFNLEDLLAIRAPHYKLSPNYFDKPYKLSPNYFNKSLSLESVQYVLIHYATVLREFAKDVLQGDFSVFSELELVVKRRLVGSKFSRGRSGNQHVVPHAGRWAVRGEGNKRVTSTHDTQAEAIERARRIATRERSEVVIHRPDGRIREKDSYGSDPKEKVS